MKTLFFTFFVMFLVSGISYSQDFEPQISKAMEYYNNEKYDSAAILFEAALPFIEKKYGATDTGYYARQVTFTAESFFYCEKFEKAEKYYLQVKSIYETIQDTINAGYATSLGNLAIFYQKMGNYEAALSLYREASKIDVEVFGPKNLAYAADINNLGLLYEDMGNYEAASPLFEESVKIVREVLGTKHTDYATVLNNLAAHYQAMGKYESALSLYKEAFAVDKEVLGPNHTKYAMDLSNLALLYQRMGNYEAALALFNEALSIRKGVLGPKHSDYANSLNNIANLFCELGNYEAALPLFKEASAIEKEVFGSKHPAYATDINNLAMVYKYLGNFEAALPLLEEAKSIRQEVVSTKHPDYAMDLNNLGTLYQAMGNYKAALPLFKEASIIDMEALGPKHPSCAMDKNNLALLYKDMGNYEAALPLMVEAKSIRQEVLGTKHPDYATALNNLAMLYKDMGNYKAALPLFKEANGIINQNIRENFSFLSQHEKEKYLILVKNNYEHYLSFLMDTYSMFPAFCSNVFDNELFLKGLILSSTTALQQSVFESGDTSLTSRYEEMRVLNRQITSELQKPISKRRGDLSGLEKEANDLDEELVRRSKTFNEMQSSLRIKWEDVKKKLKDHEAAVEFTSFHYYDKKHADSILYCAFILRNDDTLPRMTFLCDESKLKNALSSLQVGSGAMNLSYKSERRGTNLVTGAEHTLSLYDLVWRPVDNLMKGINTVYYATSGLLSTIAFAPISCPDNKILMEKYKLVQLSSTRTLALKSEPVKITNAVVYGGILYDSDTTRMLAQARKYTKKEYGPLAYYRSATREPAQGFNYLPGTQKEAELIVGSLAKKRIFTTSFFGTDASEESFNSLSGINSPSIIHISTHGFYFPDIIRGEKRKKMDLSGSGEVQFRFFDDPLLRSGLLMSGANLAWKGGKVPEGIQDGILTAKEVSNMNLTNTQLVVLSACQTGLGDVKGSEGVEGLQRGFKMAGVRYIIMSLWDVPDKETAEFMASFYDNWLGGKDLRDAFWATQLKMSRKYKDHPAKWAAFVLLE